jgi:peptidoglycan hydrolase-like protein with peptidoglycan-binding domain
MAIMVSLIINRQNIAIFRKGELNIFREGIILNKRLRTITAALATTFSLSVVATNTNLGPFNVDVVSAATGETEAPATTTNSGTPRPTSSAGQASYNAASYSSRLLVVGSFGEDVKVLQTNLNKYGYNLVVDGIFGNKTSNAVKDFQGKNGLTVDGIVGPKTYSKLPVEAVQPTAPAPTIDTVSSASVTDNALVFEKSIGKDGKWIICTTKDLVTDKELVLDGEFKNGKKNPDGTDAIQRKIALYTQDDKKNVTARFTLTAPKLTIKSPNARIQSGTFKGDVYVTVPNFQLVDAKVDGNIYFTTQEAKDTFKSDAKSSITGSQVLIEIDAVTTASVVDNAAAFEKAISKDGSWIPCVVRDLTINKELVLEGEFKNGKKNPDGTDAIQRKIGLYSQDDKHVVTRRFTLTAPKLTIKSPKSRIQGGIFKGDVYVQSPDFLLTDAVIDGNVYVAATGFNLTKNAKVTGTVYFSNEDAKNSFKVDETSSVGDKDVILVDTVTTASVVNNAEDLQKAMSREGQWIPCTTTDIITDKELVLEGAFENGKKDAAENKTIQRKIALYTQDDNKVVLERFLLKAPKLTIKSPNARIQNGTFKGDVYVSAANFQLVGAVVEGNVYFTNQLAKDTFKVDAKSLVTGKQELKAN